ncbi:hypothetical protein [Escherichia coli]|uniref:hypothetical protein n=1 Tax=Escherichia coli TaxID=562 RepID=UPI0007C3F1BC|nr:hypothetical protein [Escherichia coli]MCV5652017.1 ead/Ea22-like family protein [Escherichia coli]OAC24283.1 hypothetical protein EC2772a_37c00220 [Escherichia coli]OKU37729.1 hypothetical protein ACN83_22755 [Escherichia coli]HAW1622706.1 ead/Ea22-like family protein [Escherichia coli]HCN7781109.1 ead/Ea22-like family protein [Escherichia coli]
MSNIDKQELREEFKMMQECYSDPADRDRQVIYIAAEAVLDELEAAERRIAELSANNDSAVEALLKARHITVTLPGGYAARVGHPINETERSVMIPKDGGPWLSRFDVEHVLRMAGIRINGEG